MSDYSNNELLRNGTSPFDFVNVYSKEETTGVIAIIAAASLSGLSVLVVILAILVTAKERFSQHHYRHLVPVFLSLLVADLIQSIGSILNTRWVIEGAASPGTYCSLQGGIKQTGNVAIAVWTFMSALHAFTVLFKRGQSSALGLALKLCGGWAAVVIIVVIGPTAVQSKAHGPFYGVTGVWCWITTEYPDSQVFLEYFFEWLSSALGFTLYAVTYLRVRGNLVRTDGRWALRKLPDEEWLRAIQRDVLDAALHKLASALIWFPVAYAVLLVPISLTRFIAWSGRPVPFWATTLTAVIFNLTGLVDAMLLIVVRSTLPDMSTLPAFTTPRTKAGLNAGKAARGVTPFTLVEAPGGGLSRHTSRASTGSAASAGSAAPLVTEKLP